MFFADMAQMDSLDSALEQVITECDESDDQPSTFVLLEEPDLVTNSRLAAGFRDRWTDEASCSNSQMIFLLLFVAILK